MTSRKSLLNLLDESIEEHKLPLWELGEEANLTMKMKVSGCHSIKGIGLIFEVFEFTAKENLIQTLAILLATFETEEWIKTSKIFLDRTFFSKKNSSTDFINIMNKEIKYSIEDTYIYNIKDEFRLPLSILLSMNKILNIDDFFTNADSLKEMFGMPSETQILFETHYWDHISFEEYWVDGILPSEKEDFINMIKILSNENKTFVSNRINTTWEIQSKKLLNL